MDIENESVALLSLILRDSPEDTDYILCVLARSNRLPETMKFHSNSEYPTFYGYSNERIPLYLMGKKIISNVPRKGYAKKLLSSEKLAYVEAIINKAKSVDVNKKLEIVSKFLTLENSTNYKDAAVYLVLREEAEDFVRKFVSKNQDEISPWIRSKLGRFGLGKKLLNMDKTEEFKWPKEAKIQGKWFVFDKDNKIDFVKGSFRFEIFKILFEAEGGWVMLEKLAEKSGAADTKRTIGHIQNERLQGNKNCRAVSIKTKTSQNGKAMRRLAYTPDNYK